MTDVGLQDSAWLSIMGTAAGPAVVNLDKRNRPFARLRVRVEIGKERYYLNAVAFDAPLVEQIRPVRDGARVDLGGHFQMRSWVDADGHEKSNVGLIVMAFTVIDSPPTPAAPVERQMRFSTEGIAP